jgi:hypothetical protein
MQQSLFPHVRHVKSFLTKPRPRVANCPCWPLQQWGIDIIGKLTPTQGNYIFAVVAMEYFKKWIEAKLLTNVSSASIKKFF